MTAGTAAIAVTAALALGWYGAHFWLAEKDEVSAANRHNNAVKTMWRFRRALAVVAVIVVFLVSLWFHGHGR